MGKVISLEMKQDMMTPKGEAAVDRLAGNLESAIDQALNDGLTYWALIAIFQIAQSGIHREMNSDNEE